MYYLSHCCHGQHADRLDFFQRVNLHVTFNSADTRLAVVSGLYRCVTIFRILTAGSDSWPRSRCTTGKSRVPWSIPVQAASRAVYCGGGYAHWPVRLLWQERYDFWLVRQFFFTVLLVSIKKGSCDVRKKWLLLNSENIDLCGPRKSCSNSRSFVRLNKKNKVSVLR